MNGPVLLVGHSLRRLRTILAAMGVLLAAFQVMLVMVARTIDQTGGFRQLAALMPSFVRDLMGPSVTMFLSFNGIVCLGYFHLAVMGSLIGLTIAIATTPAGEIESGFIDLLLARPLARSSIITRTIAMAMLATALLVCLMVGGTWLGLAMLAPSHAAWPSAGLVRSLAFNLWLLLLCWSGITLAIASAARRRSVAGGTAGLLALLAFLVDYIGRLYAPIDRIAFLSPFRYFAPFDIVRHETVPGTNVLVLAGVAVAGYAAAYVTFARRDISH